MAAKTLEYNDKVFINCPFDDQYVPLLRAIIYTIYRCGFTPGCALAEDDGTDSRLDKIVRCIDNCRYGIHDISRTEANEEGLPRFNMPFELGVFYGAKRFGNTLHRNKNALILERIKYQYQKCISDLNGMDTKAHANNPNVIIQKVRDWLNTASKRKNIPGYIFIQEEYNTFRLYLPKIIHLMGLDHINIPFNDYCEIVETWITKIQTDPDPF